MNKKPKAAKYAKRKLFKKYLDLDGKIHLALSIGNSSIEKRISYLITNFKQQELNLQDCNDDLIQHKDLLRWCNDQLTRDQLEKQEILQTILEEPYSKESSRIDKLMGKLQSYSYKSHNPVITSEQKLQQLSSPFTPLNKYAINRERTQPSKQSVICQESFLSLTPELNHSMNSSNSSSSSIDNYCPSPVSSSNSTACPSSSTGNSGGQICYPLITRRMFDHHQFIADKAATSNGTCNDCLAKVSPFDPTDKKLRECSICGFHMHNSCIGKRSLHRKLCIPVCKARTAGGTGAPLRLDTTGNRTIDVLDLLQQQHNNGSIGYIKGTLQQPVVPPVFLCLMHHVHTFGRGQTNLYRTAASTASAKAVKELAEKLIKGKARAISRYDIDTVCECLKWLLGKLKEPILSDEDINQFNANSRGNKPNFTELFRRIIKSKHEKNRDILSYLLVHLKVTAGYRRSKSKNDVRDLATVFGPLLISEEAIVKYRSAAVDLLEGLLRIEYRVLSEYITEALLFLHVTELMTDPNSNQSI